MTDWTARKPRAGDYDHRSCAAIILVFDGRELTSQQAHRSLQQRVWGGKAEHIPPLLIRASALPVDMRHSDMYITRIKGASYVQETDDQGRGRSLCRSAQCH